MPSLLPPGISWPYQAYLALSIEIEGVDELIKATEELGKDMRELEYEILEEWETQMRSLLNKATATWTHKPSYDVTRDGFMINKLARLGVPFAMGWLEFNVKGSAFFYVDRGTYGPYPISAKNFDVMRFIWGGEDSYRRKTPYYPGLGAVAGGPTGEVTRRRMVIRRHGIAPTDMSLRALELSMNALDPYMDGEFNAATNRWGE